MLQLDLLKQLVGFSILRVVLSPTLLLCPSRVSEAELATDPFSARDFSVPFMLLPPIYNDDSVRQLFKKQFVFDVKESMAGQSYSRCAQSIQQAGTIHKQAARAVKVKFADRRFLDTHNTKLSRYMAEKSGTPLSGSDVPIGKPDTLRVMLWIRDEKYIKSVENPGICDRSQIIEFISLSGTMCKN